MPALRGGPLFLLCATPLATWATCHGGLCLKGSCYRVKYQSRVLHDGMKRPLSAPERIFIVVILVPLALVAGSILTEVVEPQGHVIASSPHLYLTVGFNFTTGEDQYFPANFTIPADVNVVITITNYDNGTNPVPDQYGVVTGTVGGIATIDGQTVSSIPGHSVSHTFSIMQLGVNVPIPTSSTVTFTLIIEQTGSYQWHCMAPCDPKAMSTPGFMEGIITVGQ